MTSAIDNIGGVSGLAIGMIAGFKCPVKTEHDSSITPAFETDCLCLGIYRSIHLIL